MCVLYKHFKEIKVQFFINVISAQSFVDDQSKNVFLSNSFENNQIASSMNVKGLEKRFLNNSGFMKSF